MRKYSSYILFLLITLFVAILSLNGFGPLENLQRSVNDFLCGITAPDSPRPNIVVVAIDWRAQDEFGQWPWNHDIIADLLAAIGGAEPKAIAVNLDLSEDAAQISAGYTSILAEQLSWINNAVLSYDIALATYRSGKISNPEYLFNNSVTVDNPLGLMEESSTLQVRKVFLPADRILNNKPFLGFNYTTLDEDRILRHQPLIMNYEGYYYPSLSLLAAAVYLGVTPSEIKVIEKQEIRLGSKRKIPINDRSEYFISFPKAQTFTTYSAAEVLGENFNFSRLKDKLVVVGVPDAVQQETFQTPVNSEMVELFIKAAVMENIINDNVLIPKNNQPLLNLLIILIIGAVFAFVLPQVSAVNRMIILAVGFIILVNVNYFLLSSFKIIPETVYIAFQLVLMMIASPFLDNGLIANIAAGKHEKERILPKIEIERKPHLQEPTHKTREIKSTALDPENQATAVLEPEEQYPEDHQTINLDEDRTTATATPDSGISVDEGEKVSDVDTKLVSPQPEIISPDTSSQSSQPLDWQPDDAADGQPKESKMPPIGEIRNLGRYQVTGVLGKGAMGMVYKGVDPAINRPVALKTIRLDFVTDPQEENELKERLHREAQAAGKLSHPNIVTIYDVGSEGQLQYIAMEFLEGQTLENMIKKKVKFNYRIIAQIIIQICNALDYGHSQGIVHRDIKPANVMILKDYRVKVMDYGIARVDSSSMTKTGIAMGTPNYISPEQLQGKKVDHRADLFSLGVVMYEMLLGRRPFRGENLTSLIYAIINNEPDKPSEVNPQIPLLFDHIIARALKKDPNERYQHAREIIAHLTDFVDSFTVKT